ncbi:MAG: PRC-barrel domain-containing protein [Candidatus Bathyarchaeia archaeon]|jgi:sporulation protein YlmC with PRC-barrel domain
MVEITRLFWKKAFTSDNFELGEINSAEVDMNTWQITNLYVNLSDEASNALGFKHPYLGRIMVCLPVSTVKAISDTAILNQTLEELRSLRQCKE